MSPEDFYRDCLLPLIKSDTLASVELRQIFRREFLSDGSVARLTRGEMKRFNGRAITVLRQRGLMHPPFGERAS